MSATRIEGFGRDASDLFKILTTIAGYPAGPLMYAIHKRAPKRATVATVEAAAADLRQRPRDDLTDRIAAAVYRDDHA